MRATHPTSNAVAADKDLERLLHDAKAQLITIAGFSDLLLTDVKEGNTESIQGDVQAIKLAVARLRDTLGGLTPGEK